MDLNKIDYVIAVADLKNISKAATACFVSQPALTRYIQGLERELGLKLFDRSTVPVQMTEAGARYVEKIREIQRMRDELEQEMKDFYRRSRQQIVLGMSPTRSYTWLPRILPAPRELCPSVEVRVVEDNLSELLQMLEWEQIDILFMSTIPDVGELLQFVELCREEMCLVVSRFNPLLESLSLPENQARILQYIPPQVLTQLPLISTNKSNGTYYLAKRLFDKYHISPTAVLELKNASSCYRMAPESNGFAFAPVSVILEEKFGSLPLFCSMEEEVSTRPLGLVYKKMRKLPAPAMEFIELARKLIPGYVREHIPHFEVAQDIDYSPIL